MSMVLNLLREHQAVMLQLETMVPAIELAALRILQALQVGGKVFFMGNGGSAADAQHLAAELVCRYQRNRRALAALSLTTDTSILTAVSNDYDFKQIFARQLEGLCQPEDIVVGISTSGNSPNVLTGIAMAKQLGAFTIGMTGESGGQLVNEVDMCFCVPSHTTARIQEAHIFIGHIICELIENAVCAEDEELIDEGKVLTGHF